MKANRAGSAGKAEKAVSPQPFGISDAARDLYQLIFERGSQNTSRAAFINACKFLGRCEGDLQAAADELIRAGLVSLRGSSLFVREVRK